MAAGGQPFSETPLGKIRKLVGKLELALPAVRIVIEDPQGRILMGRRSDNGNWALPGGYNDPGESSLQAICREAFEETGLRLRDPKPFGMSSEPDVERVVYPNGDPVHSFTLLYFARQWEGSLVSVDGELRELGFFAPGELPPRTQPNDARTIEMYLEFKRRGEFIGR